jgi:hypothetical protein
MKLTNADDMTCINPPSVHSSAGSKSSDAPLDIAPRTPGSLVDELNALLA